MNITETFAQQNTTETSAEQGWTIQAGRTGQGSRTRRSGLKRGLSALAAASMLAVGGFGTLSTTEAHAAGVKTSNYVITQPVSETSSSLDRSGSARRSW